MSQPAENEGVCFPESALQNVGLSLSQVFAACSGKQNASSQESLKDQS